MESKELRQFVLAKVADKSAQFEELKKAIENFCVGILIDCKDVLVELDTVKKISGLVVDEIDDRTNTGLVDRIDGPITKGLVDKAVFNNAWGRALEVWYKGIRNKALDIITSNTNNVSEK